MPAGKTALVTGANSGIGIAIAMHMASLAAKVVLVGRRRERGLSVVREIERRGGIGQYVEADVSERGVPDRIVEQIASRHGRLDFLVNNAGVIYRGAAPECSDDDWDRTILTNVTTVFRMSRAAIAPMRKQGHGVIINSASEWGLIGAQNAVAYCASKGAVVQMTRSMALDHARDRIRVVAVCQGATDTAMLDGAITTANRDSGIGTISATIPLGRAGQPLEVAKLVAYQASDDAAFITGAVISIDGGTTAM